MNKARLFDNDIKTKSQLLAAKIIPNLVNFGQTMEVTLVVIQKLVSKSHAGLSQPPLPSPKATPQKRKPLVEMKTPILHQPVKELVFELAKIEVPAAPAMKATEKESKSPKTTSSKPSSQWRSGRKKKKEPTPESREEEAKSLEEEMENSSEEPESEEEAELATPPPKKKKRIKTQSSDWKKLASTFKSAVSLKRPTKTLKKGISSKKKSKRK